MNLSKDTRFRYRGTVVSGIAGIVCAAALVCALGACESSVDPDSDTVTAGEGTEFVIHLTAISEADVIAQTAYAPANTDKPFTISGTDYTVNQWYLNGAPAGTSQTYTFNQDAGVYELAVVVTDTAGREHSGSCRVTVR